jgi:glutamine cyclotransferase
LISGTHDIQPIKKKKYYESYFGEGITLLDDDHYVALTWRDKQILIIDRQTLRVVDERSFPKDIREGWGLTHNDVYLFWSDGTSRINLVDKRTFVVLGALMVHTKTN